MQLSIIYFCKPQWAPCCVPPAPTVIDGVCAHLGGLCAPMAGCGFVDAALAPQSDCVFDGAGTSCCVPEWHCGEETQICCDSSGPTAFRTTCVCGELVGELPVAQSTVSQHLKILKLAGLIQGTIDRPRVCYCLAPGALQRLKALVNSLPEACQDRESEAGRSCR